MAQMFVEMCEQQSPSGSVQVVAIGHAKCASPSICISFVNANWEHTQQWDQAGVDMHA